MAWLNRSLIETRKLGEQEIRQVLKRAGELKKLWRGWRGTEFPHLSLRGRTVVNLFFEASTRTRSSFELAARRLGAHVLNLHPEASSVTKGETLFDTARNLEAMDPDLLVLRHASAGAPYQLSKILKIPIINAGDGFHEHPTQALLDLFTIEEAKGSAKGLNVLIVGDIAHSRVARSNIYTLRTMGARVSVCGPPSLMPPLARELGVAEVFHDLRKGIADADVVMMLRVQLERQNQMQFPSLGEYSRFWGLNADTVQSLKKGAIIMHPGPLNEGVEISQEVASGPYSVILNQVNNGVIIRMALMDLIFDGGSKAGGDRRRG
ncbi:MAG: aspartate carbamoyltransferase catalytic subunit [Deltaproteobacteria bacterium]|nr:aspartate carbamoyltransferase catalytic subunit [Deltaproteobacteria bacterium]